MYSYYESFMYRNPSTKVASIQINTFRIDVYDNLNELRIAKLQARFGRDVSINKSRTKAYVRLIQRRIRVRYERDAQLKRHYLGGFVHNIATGYSYSYE